MDTSTYNNAVVGGMLAYPDVMTTPTPTNPQKVTVEQFNLTASPIYFSVIPLPGNAINQLTSTTINGAPSHAPGTVGNDIGGASLVPPNTQGQIGFTGTIGG